MPRILKEVIEHKLGIDPSFKPIKQRKKRYTKRGTRPFSKKSIDYLKLG
jgi:hypothetical protein